MATFPKLVGFELENFMSITNAQFSFDESNIISLKGYNDSGKSAVTRALDVLFFNAYKNDQKKFIQHGKDFFRIIAEFEDGVVLIRDKYLNGNSLYEMYKDDKLLFSTKVGRTYTQVKEVPLPIREYLGMIELPNGGYLNSQSIYDKQFLIQTSGSENVEILNGVLKMKETSLATSNIKKDINDLNASITSTTTDVEALHLSLERYDGLTPDFVDFVESLDKKADSLEADHSQLKDISSNLQDFTNLPTGVPTLEPISTRSYQDLLHLATLVHKVEEVSPLPVLPKIESKGIDELQTLRNLISNVTKVQTLPVELPTLELGSLKDLETLSQDLDKLLELEDRLDLLNKKQEELDDFTHSVEEYAKKQGISISKCSNCGALVQGSAGHVHI